MQYLIWCVLDLMTWKIQLSQMKSSYNSNFSDNRQYIYIELSSDRGYFASKLTCRRKLAAFVRNYIDITLYYGFNAFLLF
jgi:hypothetical protein